MKGTEQFRLLTRIRNRIEAVSFILRLMCHADRMSGRGLSRTRLFFDCKVAALNVRKMIIYHIEGDTMPKACCWLKNQGTESPKDEEIDFNYMHISVVSKEICEICKAQKKCRVFLASLFWRKLQSHGVVDATPRK